MLILIGPGIHCIVEIQNEPQTGDEINLRNGIIGSGRFKLRRDGERTWGTGRTEYPYYTYERVGDIPEGQHPLPTAVLNI